MTKLWSGPGCEDNPEYDLVERDPATGIGRFRKLELAERGDDEDWDLEERARRRRRAPGESGPASPAAREAQRRLASTMRAAEQKGADVTRFNKRDAYAAIDAAIETLAKAERPNDDTATAVTKFLETDAGRDLYRLRDLAYSVRETGVEFAKIAAEAALESEAARIRKGNSALSAEAAYCRALEARPDLYALYLSGNSEQ